MDVSWILVIWVCLITFWFGWFALLIFTAIDKSPTGIWKAIKRKWHSYQERKFYKKTYLTYEPPDDRDNTVTRKGTILR